MRKIVAFKIPVGKNSLRLCLRENSSFVSSHYRNGQFILNFVLDDDKLEKQEDFILIENGDVIPEGINYDDHVTSLYHPINGHADHMFANVNHIKISPRRNDD